jgi:ribosomal-protein-serine acetyltransferase
VLRLPLSSGCELRLLEEADAEALAAVVAANRAHLSRWMPWAAGHDVERSLEFIRTTRRQIATNDGLQTAIICDGAIAGMIGFHRVDWQHRATSVGYWLAEEMEGRGIMTHAVAAYVEHAFGAWELHRVEIRAAVDNRRSRAVAERNGFVEEGVLRGAERVGDRYLDHVVYGMLAPDWRASCSAR